MTQSIQSLQHRVSKFDDDPMSQNQQIGYRAEAHTASAESVEYVLFVDTLVRDSDE
ncbi:hypothetical protein [Herbiconiux sp. YIM B11900]|uniref:hypothetical protein n=1 Tax=Herbiconiux sp. YIM B11900 TaxID=3404131 RepID=UPI003F86749C